MEFDIEKCAMLKMKRGEKELAEGLETQNQESIRILREKKNYKIGNTGSSEDERKNKKRVPQTKEEASRN